MIGIIGAMEEEVAILRAAIKECSTEKIGAFEFYQGRLCGKEAVLLRCGIGKVQAAAGSAAMIMKFKPDFVINSGCAGGINNKGEPALHFGDAVISTALVQHDFDITAFGYNRGQVPGRDGAEFYADSALIAKMQDAVSELKKEGSLNGAFNAVPGLIGSGDAFISDSAVVEGLKKIFPAIRAVEMEGAAIAQVCALFNTPFVVLRCLSDIAGEESPMVFDEYLPVAAKNSSAIVTRLIEKL